METPLHPHNPEIGILAFVGSRNDLLLGMHDLFEMYLWKKIASEFHGAIVLITTFPNFWKLTNSDRITLPEYYAQKHDAGESWQKKNKSNAQTCLSPYVIREKLSIDASPFRTGTGTYRVKCKTRSHDSD